MRMKVAKNGKHYRCDKCQKLLAVEDVCFWRENGVELGHFCGQKHKREYIVRSRTVPMFLLDSAQAAGSVIPAKNGTTDK